MQLVLARVGTAVARLATALLVGYTSHPWLLASLGGSCVILFAMPESDVAQLRSVLGGHMICSRPRQCVGG